MLRIIKKEIAGKLSDHIGHYEYKCRCTNPFCNSTIYDEALFDAFEQLRSYWNMPIEIKSGYRCPAHNDKVSDAKQSKHQLGMALDLKVPFGVRFDEFVIRCREIFPYVLPHVTTRVVHVDIYRR